MIEQVLLVEPSGHAARNFQHVRATRVHTADAIRAALRQTRSRALWIAPTGPALDLLCEALTGRALSGQRLLALGHADAGRRQIMRACFRDVVSADEGVQLLPIPELLEVLNAPDRADLLIGGTVALEDSAVVLIRGDLGRLVVPLKWFRPRPDGPGPDPLRFSIADHGQTVRLGEYEAATAAVLYEFDEQYRKRAKKRHLDSDTSLGGALRRLRLQKELRQADFPGVTAKEIARIERGEIKRPHRRTLATIAARLGVSVDQLASY